MSVETFWTKITELHQYSRDHPWKFYSGYSVFVVAIVSAAHYISG